MNFFRCPGQSQSIEIPLCGSYRVWQERTKNNTSHNVCHCFRQDLGEAEALQYVFAQYSGHSRSGYRAREWKWDHRGSYSMNAETHTFCYRRINLLLHIDDLGRHSKETNAVICDQLECL
jgi:hypothetical protein